MKVMQVLPSLNVGGVERGVIDLARAMKRLGHETVVVSSGGELVDQLHKIGCTHYTLPVHKKSLLSLSLVPKLAALIRQENIDVVHGRSRVPAWIAWLAARRTGVPFVTTCHGYYSDHALSRVMGWGKIVIAISSVIARHMIDDFGVSPERIRQIYRGVDLSQFSYQPERAPFSASRPARILNVGRLSPIKGQVEFLKAIHLVRRIFPHIEVALVGSEEKGKHKYTDLIRQTMKQFDLESCVKLLGTRRDIPELMTQADLLVLSTLTPEAFGRVLIEAGAVGTPVLATRVGGISDVIDDGTNGTLVMPGNIEDMAQGILKVLKERDYAKACAKKLREKVEQKFTLDGMVEQTLQVYREVQVQKKIAVIKLGAAGDLILAVPSLRMIRQRYPNSWISVIVDRKHASLISNCPYINELIPVDRKKLSKPDYLLKQARKLRHEGFDLSVDLQNSKWTHLLSFLSGIPERYGYRRGWFGRLLNRPDRSFETVDAPVRHQFRILSRMGVREFDEALELWTDHDTEERIQQELSRVEVMPGERLIGLVIGSSPQWPTKRWPIEHFATLARRIHDELKARCILIGTNEDLERGRELEAQKIPGLINLVGRTSPREWIALVHRLDLLVTGDTASLHVAAAMKIPIVALFGPTDARRHMPPAQNAAVINRHLPCQPCYSGECYNPEKLACLTRISPDEVMRAIQRQLSMAQEALRKTE